MLSLKTSTYKSTSVPSPGSLAVWILLKLSSATIVALLQNAQVTVLKSSVQTLCIFVLSRHNLHGSHALIPTVAQKRPANRPCPKESPSPTFQPSTEQPGLLLLLRVADEPIPPVGRSSSVSVQRGAVHKDPSKIALPKSVKLSWVINTYSQSWHELTAVFSFSWEMRKGTWNDKIYPWLVAWHQDSSCLLIPHLGLCDLCEDETHDSRQRWYNVR